MMLPRAVRGTEEMTRALTAQLIFLLSPHHCVSPSRSFVLHAFMVCIVHWSSLLVIEYLSISTWLSHRHRFSQTRWLLGNLQTQLIGTNSLVMWKFHLNVLRYKNKGQDATIMASNVCSVHNWINLRFKNKLIKVEGNLRLCILLSTPI